MDRDNSPFHYDNDESSLDRDFAQVSVEEIEPLNGLHNSEIVYRAISVQYQPSANHFTDQPSFCESFNSETISKPVLSREKPTLSREKPTSKETVVISQLLPQPKTSNLDLKPSDLPVCLINTHFEISMPLSELVPQIDAVFRETNYLSYDFDSSLCQWTAMYLNGSSHSKIQVIIYLEKQPNLYVVEGNRLMGDNYSFRTIYSQIKSRLTSSKECREFDSFAGASPLPMACTASGSGGDFNVCFDFVFRMAREKTVEAQLESTRIICELSSDPSMQQLLVDRGVLPLLRDLICCETPCQWLHSHAVHALSNLSDANIFQDAIIKEGFLPVLLRLACDGPYQTAELRRSAVHILANICSSNSGEVARALGVRELASWMSSVDDFKDERLKQHANRAKECLSRVVFAS